MGGMEVAAASGILNLVGNKLAPLLIKEYSSIVGVKKDLEELQSLLKEINSWLERAGYIATGNDPSLNWLKKLKDVAYDVDDVVDEFKLKAEKHEADGDGVAVSKYMRKKAKSVIFQCKAASNIKVIKKRFSAIVRQRTEFGAIANTLPGGHSQTTVVMPTLPIVDVSSVIGRDQEKSKIISTLKEVKDQQEIDILSIIGLGGSGKTTLAKLVFSDDDTIKKIFKFRIWVHVSQEYSVIELIKNLFEAITEENSEQHHLNHLSERISKKLTGERFLLVLDDVWIEDRIQWVQFQEQFMVHLKNGTRTSKILLTTRSQRVAEVVESTDLFRLPFLSPDDSWQLFTRRFSATVPSEFEEVGKDIVKKCDGVPLAIIALACVLRDKDRIEQWQAIRNNSSLDVEDAQDGIFARLRLSYFYLPSHLKPCFTICSVFPKGYTIDKGKLIDQWIAHDMIGGGGCVGYLEYTADEYFNSLVRMSFLQDVEETNGGRVKCRMHDVVHDLARSILNNDETLLDRVNEETNFKKSYRYFSLIEEPINDLPKNLFKKARAVFAYELYNSRFSKAWKNVKHLRSITVMNYGRTESVLTAILQIKTLRYLDVQGLKCKELPKSISDIWSLQSLHLTSSYLVKLPKTIGKLMKLRTLNLSYCSQLKCLPDSIGDCQLISSIDLYCCHMLAALPNSIGRNENLRVLRSGSTKIVRLPSSITTLRNLECLDLCGCTELVELPEGIGNMEKLQVLNLKDCDNLGGMPVGIGHLSRLHKLDLFVVGEGENFAGISELANLPRIGEELSIKFISQGMVSGDAYKAECLKKMTETSDLLLQSPCECKVFSSFSSFKHLKKLKLELMTGSGRVLELLQYMTALEELTIRGFDVQTELPESLGSMTSLQSLCLNRFSAIHTLPEWLGELWSLQELTINFCDSLSSLPQSIGRLTALQVLMIERCNALHQLPEGVGELSSLRELKIWYSGLTCLPQSIGRLTALQVLLIEECDALHQLPEGVGELSSLRELDIYKLPGLTCLPQSMCGLTSLEKLYIGNCPGLASLPAGIKGLASLKELIIQDCLGIKSLPKGIKGLTALRKLRIIRCPDLAKGCESGKGKDWHLISHIPLLDIC